MRDRPLGPAAAAAAIAALGFAVGLAGDACHVASGATHYGCPLAEIVLVELGAASYADDSLFGVAPWLPCLYFGAGAVASGLWAAVSGHASSPSRS